MGWRKFFQTDLWKNIVWLLFIMGLYSKNPLQIMLSANVRDTNMHDLIGQLLT